MPPASILKPARLLHLYLGVFSAPALIFFAITGGLQSFSLHETTRGSSYKPPKILTELSQFHKKQTFVIPPGRPAPPVPAPTAANATKTAAAPAHEVNIPQASREAPREAPPQAAREASRQAPPSAPPVPAKNLLPMKIFFAIISIGLLLSTLTGVYMSYKYARNALPITAVLLAGVVFPILLTLI